MEQVLQFIADHIGIVVAGQGVLAALSGLFALLGWGVASKLCGSLSVADLGRLVRVLQAIFAANKQASKTTLNGLFIGACVLLMSGCGAAAVHGKVQQMLVFEDQVHAQVMRLRAVADETLPMLPADKQEEYRVKLAAAYDVLGKALDAKDTALQAALTASESSVDVTALTVQIVSAIEQIVGIVNTFATAEKRAELTGSSKALKARWVKQ